MRTVVVIPARLESTRLPNKLLLKETGKSLLWYAWSAAQRSGLPVYIATDSREIMDEVSSWGSGQYIETAPHHKNGTSRLVEAREQLPGVDLFINLQGDHPDVRPEDLCQLDIFMRDHKYDVGTLATTLPPEELNSPSVVKVAVTYEKALYFSRGALAGSHKHVGVYAYWRQTLSHYSRLSSPLGEAEKLEQLAWLEAGMTIGVVFINHPVIGIDTREDYDSFSRIVKNH